MSIRRKGTTDAISLADKSFAAITFEGKGVGHLGPTIQGANPLQVLLAIADVEAGRIKPEQVEIAEAGGAAVVALIAAGPDAAMGRCLVHHASPYPVRGALLALKLQAEDAMRVRLGMPAAVAKPKRSELVIPSGSLLQ